MTMEDTWTDPPAPMPEPVPINRPEPKAPGMPKAERDEWLAALKKAAAARDRAGETYARKLAAMRTLIKEANDAGVPMTDVAVAANVARSRAHRLYKKAGRPVSQGDLLRD